MYLKYSRVIFGLFLAIILCSGTPYKRGILSPANYPIPVFESATALTPYTYVVQANTDYTCYEAYILDDTDLRFRAKIRSGWEVDSTECVTGWINKTNVVVDILENGYDDQGGYIYLYESPESETRIKIYTKDTPREAIVIDFYRDKDHDFYNWAKVSFTIGDVYYTGWIDRFCSSAWGGCN